MLKKQMVELEHRVRTLEDKLADVYKPKLWPLPTTNESQVRSEEGQARRRRRSG